MTTDPTHRARPARPRIVDAERRAAPIDPRPRRRRPHPGAVLAGSLALFFTLLALLAMQMRGGGDPALGAGRATTQLRRPAQVVVVHRVVRRIVVVHKPAASPAASATPTAAAAPAASIPAAAAPAPVAATPAPAPAPAPAPVVTRAS